MSREDPEAPEPLAQLHASNRERAQAGRCSELRLAAELRCVLIDASLRSLAQLPSQQLIGLAREGIWSLERARRVARCYEPGQQAQSLTELSTVALERQEALRARTLLQEALEAAGAIPDANERTRTQAAVQARWQAAQEPPDSAAGSPRRVEHDVSSAQRQPPVIHEELALVQALSAVAAQLQGDPRQTALRRALEVATSIQDTHAGSIALATVAAQLPAELKHRALQQALDTAAAIQNEWWRAEALGAAAPHLEDGSPLMQQALEIATALHDHRSCARALAALAPQLHGESLRAALHQALTAAGAISNDWWRATTLSALAAHMDGEQRPRVLQQARAAAEAIQDEWRQFPRVTALCALAARLDGEARQAVLEEATSIARLLVDESERARALGSVAAHLTGEHRHRALERALKDTALIQNERERAEALDLLAVHLAPHPDLQAVCLDVALRLSGAEAARIAVPARLARLDPAILTYDLWHDLLAGARLTRPALLGVIPDLAWMARELTQGTQQTEEIAHAVHGVCEALP